MLKKITRILPFLIATLLAVGGVELFYRLLEHYILEPPAERVAAVGEPAGPEGLTTPMERHQNYDVITQRNLFRSYTEGEAPPPVEVEENPLAGLETTTLDLVLMGTVSGEAGNSRAIILDKRERSQEIYYQGDVIEGAEIKEILRGKVILSYDGKDEILDMSEAATMRPNVPDINPSLYEYEEPEPPAPTVIDPDNVSGVRENIDGVEPQGIEENFEPEPLEYQQEGGPEAGQPLPEAGDGGTLPDQSPQGEKGMETERNTAEPTL